MAQARRKTTAKTQRSSHGLGLFLSGLVTGAVAMAFFQGWRSDDSSSIGRGLAHMLESSRTANSQSDKEQNLSEPAQKPISTSLDFYAILPEIETVMSEQESTESDTAKVKPEPTATVTQKPAAKIKTTPEVKPVSAGTAGVSNRYILQAGAFARAADADRLKAQLALSGLESHIQKVTIQNRGDFYRVRLGPFENTNALNYTSKRLAGLGIKPLRFKLSKG
ncbi:MAG: cell division protein FtsN [Parasphingorhabdus sp.]|jgi:cell division protein FtsN